ncbi:MAG: TIGR03905 family TSCPD domain-containing protein [Clostridia bacterium]|nr:TIGR03905 family TSCPD domain-containing protein [Clostridia bacterium]
MAYQYRTRGVCSRNITFDIVDGKVVNVHFDGGCNGNTQGIARLVEGMPAEEAVRRMEGITCGFKGTSCPDQLAQAIKQALSEDN